MFPETEPGQEPTSGSEETAVVVDLTESDEKKLVKPLTVTAGDEGGTTEDDDAGERRNQNADDDFQSTGRKDFDKRLKREMRQKVQARADAAAATEEAERLRQENAELRRAPVVRDEPPNTADLDAKISTAQTKLAKALEDGESTTAAALQVEIGSLTGQKAAREAAPRRQQEQPAPRREQPAPKKGMTATGKAFVTANDEWWSDPEHAAARSAVIALDQQLITAGSDPNSESHYARIARRAKAMGLKVKIRQPFDEGDDMGNDTVDLSEPQRREQRRDPPQGGNGNIRQRGNSELRDARAGKIVLTEKDKETMRTFKLDPSRPDHIRAFAKSRQERVLQEAQS